MKVKNIGSAALWGKKETMTDRPRILVVDDEPQISRVLRTNLSMHGYEIEVANGGEVDAKSRVNDKVRRNEGKMVILPRWRPDISTARKSRAPGWCFANDRSPKG
jgi:DNA-binding NtrC family response regulator